MVSLSLPQYKHHWDANEPSWDVTFPVRDLNQGETLFHHSTWHTVIMSYCYYGNCLAKFFLWGLKESFRQPAYKNKNYSGREPLYRHLHSSTLGLAHWLLSACKWPLTVRFGEGYFGAFSDNGEGQKVKRWASCDSPSGPGMTVLNR